MNPSDSPAAPVPSPDGDDRLESMLRSSMSSYVDDAGFTARVLTALPEPRQRRERRRVGLLLGAGALGCVGATLLGAGSAVPLAETMLTRLEGWSSLPVPGLGSMATMGTSAVLVVALVTGWWSRSSAR